MDDTQKPSPFRALEDSVFEGSWEKFAYLLGQSIKASKDLDDPQWPGDVMYMVINSGSQTDLAMKERMMDALLGCPQHHINENSLNLVRAAMRGCKALIPKLLEAGYLLNVDSKEGRRIDHEESDIQLLIGQLARGEDVWAVKMIWPDILESEGLCSLLANKIFNANYRHLDSILDPTEIRSAALSELLTMKHFHGIGQAFVYGMFPDDMDKEISWPGAEMTLEDKPGIEAGVRKLIEARWITGTAIEQRVASLVCPDQRKQKIQSIVALVEATELEMGTPLVQRPRPAATMRL